MVADCSDELAGTPPWPPQGGAGTRCAGAQRAMRASSMRTRQLSLAVTAYPDMTYSLVFSERNYRDGRRGSGRVIAKRVVGADQVLELAAQAVAEMLRAEGERQRQDQVGSREREDEAAHQY